MKLEICTTPRRLRESLWIYELTGVDDGFCSARKTANILNGNEMSASEEIYLKVGYQSSLRSDFLVYFLIKKNSRHADNGPYIDKLQIFKNSWKCFIISIGKSIWRDRRTEERPKPCAMSSKISGVQISALPLISSNYVSLIVSCIIDILCLHRNTPTHEATGKTQIYMWPFLSLVMTFTKVDICLSCSLFS